jgi:hypothetical protein
MVQQHNAAIGFATNVLPLEGISLAMILEEHKEVMRLRRMIEERGT